MADGRQEDEAERLFRMVSRKGGGDRAAKGMADDDGLGETEAIHQRGDCVSLRRQRFVVAAFRPAEARPVEKQHLGTAFEQRPERQHLVVEVGAGAMDENDRRQIAAGGSRDMDVVDPGAVDLGELTHWRIAALNHPEAGTGNAGQGKDGRDEEEKRGEDEVHARKYEDGRN